MPQLREPRRRTTVLLRALGESRERLGRDSRLRRCVAPTFCALLESSTEDDLLAVADHVAVYAGVNRPTESRYAWRNISSRCRPVFAEMKCETSSEALSLSFFILGLILLTLLTRVDCRREKRDFGDKFVFFLFLIPGLH